MTHPALKDWFGAALGQPTAVQQAAWPKVAAGHNVLISAPTGSGKTLAAWLPLLDGLVNNPVRPAGVSVLYLTPLRALSRDMVANLAQPLQGLTDDSVRPVIALRTGDTPADQRRRMRQHPPDVLVTTPESLFVLLGSRGGARMLETVRAVLVDEIHALADSKRGAHLALSLERLEGVARAPVQRIGVSATCRPLEVIAGFLCGTGRACEIVHVEAQTPPQLRLELPARPLDTYADLAHWQQIHARLFELAGDCRSLLVFCNTRAQVERSARALSELLGEDKVAAHHGSLGIERRREVEQGLKAGALRVVVSSASLELGLDIGQVDRVCQLGSPGRINVLRQRAGRSRHSPDQRPEAYLFPLNLGDLLEAHALSKATAQGELDTTVIPAGPVDVLCQHLVAMVGQGVDNPDELFGQVRRAWPWRELERGAFQSVLDMLCDGFVPGRESPHALVRRAAGGHRLVPGENAVQIALMNAGTIPEAFEYQVIDAHDNRRLGSLDQEFAFESSPGQIMQLGNRTLRILRIGTDTVWVEAAPDETPNIPFWFGEGSGRSEALSRHVQQLMNSTGPQRHCEERSDAAIQQYEDWTAVRPTAAGNDEGIQLHKFLSESRRLLGTLPGPDRIVLERFFDPGGDQHLVIHALVGARINRAWGLALRKRFCRRFNFELQAAATENAVLISLGATHSFALAEVIGYLKAASVRGVLTQALLDTPLYQTRFRWCANTALAIRRMDTRGRVPAQIQRNQTENLIARVFPDQLACLENIAGEREIPDHPLVQQALVDCLENYLDAGGLEAMLAAIESGACEVVCVDTPEPSPLARVIIHAPRHAYLDPTGAEERRTRAFEAAPGQADTSPAAPDPDARLRRLRQQCWIHARNRHEFEHELMRAGYLTSREGETGVSVTGAIAGGNWVTPFQALVRDCAAVSFYPDNSRCWWAPVARLAELLSVWPQARIGVMLPKALIPAERMAPEEALKRLLLGRIRVLGPASGALLGRETGLPAGAVEQALCALEGEGALMAVTGGQWAHREALAE